jgi:TRAP-type C4-dicarboxylate transport system permease small subunit
MRRALDAIYDGSAWLAGLAMLSILIITLLQVLGGVSDFFVRGTDAYAGYAMAAASFFALAHTLKRGEHIRVTLFLQRMPAAPRRTMEILCLGISVFLVGYFSWFAWDMVYWSWEFDSKSDAMDASPLWIPQLAMALGASALAIAFADELVQVLMGRDVRESDLTADKQHTE